MPGPTVPQQPSATAFYEIPSDKFQDLQNYMPAGVNLAFESHTKYYTSDVMINDLISKYGGLIDLAFSSVLGKNIEQFKLDHKSDVYLEYSLQKNKTKQGFDAYEKMFGIINSYGGLGTSVDTVAIPAYKQLTDIRMMLKDGAFEMALRYWITDINHLNLLSEEVSQKCVAIIEDLCKKFGSNEDTITVIKSAAKGSI